MFHDGEQHLAPRQLWNIPADSSTYTAQAYCTPFALPSNGIIQLGDSSAITLTTDVVFQPECTGTDTGDSFPVGYLKDPFYSSPIPMVYVIASATVIAWILVVMLAITPRTSFFGLPNSVPTFSNGHGIIGGANGGSSGWVSGSGTRPWLQKLATLFVAISLTIATADTLEVAEKQYYSGISDAGGLRREVLGSLEIRITRVVSDIFVWLAQVQTLIRLFPRHKEKVLIKWIGFVLIILDTIFSCLNSFLPGISYTETHRRPVDAIPALSYLFELALGLLYAAWVLYYSMSKRRYAYYSSKMHSISLIALLSIIALLTPVVFFVTDVSNQDVAGWGDYFRWVGAAAASVVVWEWVDRIEALERDDKKDGILGREIFDGDEMLDIPTEDGNWNQSRGLSRNFRRRGHDDNHGGNQASAVEHGLHGMTNRFRSRHQQSPQHFPLGRAHSSSEQNSSSNDQSQTKDRVGHVTFGEQPRPGQAQNHGVLGGPTPPPPVVSPVSRADTTSAASTVYIVRYDQIADVPQPIRRRATQSRNDQRQHGASQRRSGHVDKEDEKDFIDNDEEEPQPNRNRESGRWRSVHNPFKRKRTSPPQEVQQARAANPETQRATTPAHSFSRWDVRNRLGALAAETGDRFRERSAGRRQQADVPVTVVPARPRESGRTWSPDEVAAAQKSGWSTERSSGDVPSSGAATSTTLVNDGPEAQAQSTESPANERTQNRTATTRSPPAIRTTPSRADDISPSASRNRGNATIVVAAPPRRSPAAQTAASPPIPGRNSTGSAGLSSHRSTPANNG